VAGQAPFDFGDWRVDPASGELTGAGERRARLEPQLMDLLALFAGSGGRVLGKDEIVAAAWGGRAIGDDTLAGAISRLRRALGESPQRRYIETIPKRGYRCVAAAPETASPAVRRGAPTPGPPEAEALVAQGRRALATPLPGSLAQARRAFEAAVAAAPGWAPAHQGLADALIARQFAGQGGDAVAAAKAAAHAAVGLAPDSAEAHATLGLVLLLADRDFEGADAALRRAIALDPALATAHRRRAFAFATAGRFVEAERAARRAVELQPRSLEARGELLQVLLAARRFRHAAAEAAAALALAPDASEALYGRGWALVFAGDTAAGIDSMLQGLAQWGVDHARVAELAAIFEREGLAATCAAAADLFDQQQMLYVRRLVDLAVLRAMAGQPDAAFAALDEAATRDDPVLLLFPWLPHFDGLKRDARYEAFVGRLRLVR
jgi:DNA-binding winged helix-turn-helix (wHTH) protein